MHRKNNEAMQRVEEREREGGGRSVPSPLPPPLPLSTLIASSRSTDQTDRELKRSLALLRLALWPRRNTGTLERAAWLEPLARVSIETRFFSIYCPLLAGFFESIVRMYIYIYVSVMRRESGCSLDDGDYGSVKFFFQGNVTILISKFVALSVIDRFLMPFLKYFILFHPIFDEPCAGWNYHFCLWSGRKIIFETAIFILIKIFWNSKKFLERHDRSFCILIDFRTMNYSTFHPSFSILSFYFSIFFKILISTPKFEN